ncbi:ATP-binding cassette domain-containing protein [Adhaeribacter pallidiroseus]|uniref:Molybdate-transporting ATPase n=1 Tax=Adhaeribacter pallidiroseus TaxID=2072847 RepID=A0A369QDB2_9BACT|nr:ATP-binding cassette domain-containing protein [Adhaeribacter pallidiroseus]RDC62320.1 Molybdate-transporting ATPase [Adhaeribacter pallidiroseus]
MIQVEVTKQIKTYNGQQQLQIKTSFAPQATTQIFGPSGAGKTTFLKILAGLVQPEQGLICVHQQIWLDTHSNICLPPQKRKVGFVFQDYALFPHLTVEQHLLYGTTDQDYVQHLLEIGQMTSFRRHKPRHLSGGQQQRLALLRALSTKPHLLLMDEPFSALDNTLKQSIITDLKPLLVELKTTCLIVTHYPAESADLAEHTFELQ